MSDTIGRISVPALVDSGLTFPLTSDFGYGFSQERPVVVHQFGEVDAKAEQRYAVGLGPRKFAFRRQHLSMRDRATLVSFWESLQGSWKSFTYNLPNPDQTTTPTKVTWEYAPLAIQYLANACQTGFNFVEVPDPTAAPSYAVNSICLRFPSTALQSALLSQVQQIIPLVHIRVRESAVPDIYLSDRRVTVGGQLYLPRLIGIGEPGSDVIISQDIKGTADNVQFTFGNADRVMTQLANDTDLKFAQIDLSLFHVNSGILLQLWSGFIISFVADGSPQFTAQCSDGLYQITQMYPARAISRQCWKTFNDGVNCPYAAHGSGGDPTSCDYYFDSTNGCQAHGMTSYFGGHPAEPQGVSIKDNSTGLWGFGRSTVTATSIISDSIWGNALQEIWCHDDGDPGKAFWVNCMIAAGRDESDFYDALGIVGAGPIGRYTGMLVYQNADGYRYIIAPMLDGQPPHGFKVDGSLNVVSNNPTMGLREVVGTDPAVRCLLAGPGHAAGVGTATGGRHGVRRDPPYRPIRDSAIDDRPTPDAGADLAGADRMDLGPERQPHRRDGTDESLLDCGQHTASRARPGWHPFGDATESDCLLSSLVVGDGSGAAEIADTLVTPVVGTGVEKQFRFQGVLAQQKPFRDWLVEVLACGSGISRGSSAG